MSDRIMVSFQGDGAGIAALTWGQQHVWDAIEALKSPMNMCGLRSLPPDATIDEFVEELRYYTSRFQGMRTLLRLDPDGGYPQQVVASHGTVPLIVRDCSDSDDPEAVAAEVVTEQKALAFDYEYEYGIRMILLRQSGTLTHLVTTLNHVMVDAAGGFAMYTDYINRVTTPVRTQILDLAAAQTKPPARRASDASLAHWSQHLRTLPATRFHPPADVIGPRYWQLEVTSPLVFLGVRAIAARTAVDPSAVLMMLWALATTRLSSCNPAVIQTLVSNRFRPGLAETVNNISQAGLVVVDVAGVTVDEAAARTRRAATSAYKHAYFDFAAWKELVNEVARERGETIELGCYFNERPAEATALREITPDDISAAEHGPSVWTELPFFNEKLMLTIDPAPEAYVLLVMADTAVVTRDEMAALISDMATIAATAAFDSGVSTKVD